MNKIKIAFISIVIVIVIAFLSYKATYALFSSNATSTNNVFAAAQTFPTPTPIPVKAGDVVLNELDWAGSTQGTADEWIELRNTTSHTIDIGGWQITKWVTSGTDHEDIMLTIPTGKSIPANGFFLIADKSPGSGSDLTVTPELIDSSVVLDNTNLQIKLYVNNWNSGGLLVDTAGNKNTPLAGQHDTGSPKKFYSMERNSTPSDGTQAANWHTATTSANISSDSGQNKGTPDAVND